MKVSTASDVIVFISNKVANIINKTYNFYIIVNIKLFLTQR